MRIHKVPQSCPCPRDSKPGVQEVWSAPDLTGCSGSVTCPSHLRIEQSTQGPSLRDADPGVTMWAHWSLGCACWAGSPAVFPGSSPVSLGVDRLAQLLCARHRLDAVCMGHTAAPHSRSSNCTRVHMRSGKKGSGLLFMVFMNFICHFCMHRGARMQDPKITCCVFFRPSQPGALGRHHIEREVQEATRPGRKAVDHFPFRWFSVVCG